MTRLPFTHSISTNHPPALLNSFSDGSTKSPVGCRWDSQSQSLCENVPGLIYQFLLRQDGSMKFLFLSPSVAEFFEIEQPEIDLDTESLVAMIHPQDREEFYRSIAEAAKYLESWRWAGRFILPSGQIKWIQWDAQPSLQANGNIFWNGLLVDVTSHQQLQREVDRLSFLLELTERLQSSTNLEEIAQFALNYLAQMTHSAFGEVKEVCEIDAECQAQTLSHYISAELIATYGESAIAELETVLKQDISQTDSLVWEVVKTGQPILIKNYADHLQAPTEFSHSAGGKMGIFPIPGNDGKVIGVITLAAGNLPDMLSPSQQELLLAACRILGIRIERAKDRERLARTNAELLHTSKQMQAQAEQLEQTLSELQHTQTQLVQSEKMSSLGQLVAGITHEINNPVSFIQGNIPHAQNYFQDLLSLLKIYQQSYPQPVPEVRLAAAEIDLNFLSQDLPKVLSSMEVGAKRIKTIVQSLRNFSRLDESQMKDVDIHEGLENTLLILGHRLKAQADRPKIEVMKDYGDLPAVDCFPGQLNQVFINILTNAIDALDEAANRRELPLPQIQIRTTKVNEKKIAIAIRDNGLGILSALQSRLFDPFFTTKPIGKGTGLGLSISYQIITEEHHGTLTCFSKLGEGTEFLIEIPLHQPQQIQRVFEHCRRF